MSENNTNLRIWNAVEATDPKHTKQFNRGGGFKGTATNATYLAKKATAQFGPLGLGWGWNVIDEKYQPGHDKEVIHVVRIKLWYMLDGQRGEIEHFGQTTFVGKNRNGWFTDEEAPKKSLTDAISKSLSGLGFAADIHLGMYDDNRYVNDLKRDFRDGDEFDTAPASNDNRRDDRRDDRDDRRDSRDDDRGDQQQGGNSGGSRIEDLIIKCETQIREAQDIKAVTDLMNSKDMKDAMAEMSKQEVTDLRSFATQRLKDLGWVKPAKEKAAANG
ncbi:hypothetical protein FXV83_15930 [Bradyrhizobium hipponense]|uniref:Rad52/22 family double-strand break repair protein n=1 Tax=Bradyrhizobium hipponense TaxID=2605638 RepID=A0A5S4YP40_9BRAD|nr:hypothetical protein [Bradyrhizobium hipponense]TYO65424.1 hypothetical protein FXV83_15930 [Bradyrhizobium hipponense]